MKKFLQTFTNLMYCLVIMASLVWISLSYVIGIYAVVVYGQVEALVELSADVVRCIMVVLITKTIGNIFEHNNGGIFGYSDCTFTETNTETTEEFTFDEEEEARG